MLHRFHVQEYIQTLLGCIQHERQVRLLTGRAAACHFSAGQLGASIIHCGTGEEGDANFGSRRIGLKHIVLVQRSFPPHGEQQNAEQGKTVLLQL